METQRPIKDTDFEVAKCDLRSINIESMIQVIRGQQVMLDSDLAMLYGVETKRLNEQVKRNINRFPEDFMFQLTKEEASRSRSQIVTLNNEGASRSQIATLNTKRGQNIKYLPYAFTRNGIAMLSSVLRSETAIGVNILIMRAFTSIPQIVNHNAQVIQRISATKALKSSSSKRSKTAVTFVTPRFSCRRRRNRWCFCWRPALRESIVRQI